MKDCTHCKWADWEKTKNGRLHPSGSGGCKFKYKLPALPAAFYWGNSGLKEPQPYGGHINRRDGLKTHCQYFARIQKPCPPSAKPY